MKYKWSIYNILISQEMGNSVVFNTKTGNICKLSNTLFVDAATNQLERFTSHNIDLLYNNGFIVDRDLSEFNKILDESFRMAENTRHPIIDVTIAPSLKCNMHCNYCFERGIESDIKSSIMSIDVCKATIDYILGITQRSDIKKVNLTWFGGEPLLQYGMLVEMTKKIKSNLHPSIQLGTRLVTNGYLLTKEKIKELINACDLEYVQISIDGLKEGYLKTRNIPEYYYSRVIENIIECSMLINTRIRLNANPDNISELYEFVNTLAPHLKKKMNIQFCLSEIFNIPSTDRRDIKVFPPGTFRNEYRRFSIYIQKLGFPSPGYYVENFYPLACKYFMHSNVAIDPNGNLYKCEHHFGEREYIIGDVFKGKYVNSKRLHIYYDECINSRCKICAAYPICKYATCSDYRQSISNDDTNCSCYEAQMESIKTDIHDNISHLPHIIIY